MKTLYMFVLVFVMSIGSASAKDWDDKTTGGKIGTAIGYTLVAPFYVVGYTLVGAVYVLAAIGNSNNGSTYVAPVTYTAPANQPYSMDTSYMNTSSNWGNVNKRALTYEYKAGNITYGSDGRRCIQTGNIKNCNY